MVGIQEAEDLPQQILLQTYRTIHQLVDRLNQRSFSERGPDDKEAPPSVVR
jgi:DNA-directed RNA polymerase specialized sigma24 family protein